MSEKIITTKGYYTIYEIKQGKNKTYKIDNGKTLYVAQFKKTIPNPYRDIKTFSSLDKAINYIAVKLQKNNKRKKKKLKKISKSLYLVLIKEKKTDLTFIKVGFTTKKYIQNRFSKKYGYDGYVVKKILRRIKSNKAEKMESKVKNILKKKESIKKYRPILENFSGYSECFDYSGYNDIIKIFDDVVKKMS